MKGDEILRGIRKGFMYELKRKPEKERKSSFQKSMGSLFIWFLAMMFLLTLISRAAASAITPRVDVISSKKGVLTFNINGVGVLEAKAEKYLDLYKGVRVSDVFVTEGENIEEGNLLFQYDLNDLNSILEDLEGEIKREQLSLKKMKLNVNDGTNMSYSEMAMIKLERDQLDLEIAKENLEIAKNKIDGLKKQDYEEKEKAYLTATETYENQEYEREKALRDGNQKVADAQESLDELYADKDKEEVETLIANFKSAVQSKDFEMIYKAEEDIFKKFYGEEEYKEHKKEVERAQKALSRANEDYRNRVLEGWEPLSSSEYTSYQRAIEDAENLLSQLTKKDSELRMVLSAYQNGILYSMADIEKTYNDLFSKLYTENTEKEKLINTAAKTLTLAKESLADTIYGWERHMEKAKKDIIEAKEDMDRAKAVYDEIINQTYDYSEEVRVESMLIMTAERSMEDAKLELENAKTQDRDSAENNTINKQSQNIDLELKEMELHKKEEAVVTIKELLKNEGKVFSPVTGALVEFNIAMGNLITGTERVCFSLSNYGFKAKVTKEEVKHLFVGDEIKVSIGNSKEEVSVLLESIGDEDFEGKFTITGIMPKGEYTLGTPVSFKISKQSRQYDNTIPIQALRMDKENKTFVLILEETNTVLGNELTTLRMDVTVLEKDYLLAAIENSPFDNIIVSSNKQIKDRDRVRLNQTD